MVSDRLRRIRLVGLPWSPPGKRNLCMVRMGLILSAGGILLSRPGSPAATAIGGSVVGIFLLSHLGMYFLPIRTFQTVHLKLLMVLADTFLLGLVLAVSGLGTPRLYLFFFLMILIIALGESPLRIFLASAFLTAVCLFGSLAWHPSWADLSGIPHPVLIPFFAIAALYYGNFVADMRRRDFWTSQIHREREELRTLLDILETTNSTLEFQPIMHGISTRMAELLHSTRVSIVLVDPKRKECSVLASSDDRGVNRLPIRLEKYPEIQRALKTRAPVIIQDIEKSPLVASAREELRRLGFRSLLVIPLQYGEEIFGTICLRASRERGGFAPDEVRFARIVASAAANAVKNSVLYRRVQEESRQHQTKAQQLRLLFDNLPDLVFVVDPYGRISDFNRSASRLTGFALEDILERDLREVWPSSGSFPRLMERIEKGHPLDVGEVQLNRKGGGRLDVRLTLSPLGVPGQAIQGIIAIGQDLSEQKLAQMRLLHVERLSSVGELLATVAHELRGRLTGVLGFSELVVMRNKDPDLARDLEKMSSSAEQCKKIVNDLLSFSRKSEPDRKVLGVNGILRKALDLLERQMEESQVRVVLELDPELPLSFLDFQQIQQVFVNILRNAQQAIASTKREGTIRIRTYPDGKEVVVEIQDTGPGMTPEVAAKIFDPFFTTKPSGVGTGLGLSISYGIVSNHEGRIELESEPGRGARFRVRLPIHRAAEKPAAKEETAVKAGNQKILVVDDDPTIVDLYLEILRGMGHRVDTAANGLEALRKIQENHYDLVISDLKMPRMSGVELLQRIHEQKPEMKNRIVITTGDLGYLNCHQYMILSNLPCLVKPLDIQEVERVVDEVLAR